MGETQYRLPFLADKIAELLNIVKDLGAWAKASEKPTYTADEVGARPSTWTPSASEVGADPAGTAAGTVSSHNTAEDAHEDIRLLIAGLTSRLNALADSDDTTLDQLSELVAYIKANRELIEQVTTGKVSVSDIIDNLTTNVSNKPLSAAQGVVLKGLIDTLQTAVNSAAANLSSHTGNDTVHITSAERTKWNQAVTDVGNLSKEIANYLPKFVGTDKVGKIAIVGTDGYITWIDMPEGSSADVTGVVDEANNILLSGNLASGTYTMRYENEDGTLSDPVTMVVGAIVTYTITQNLTNVTSDNSATSVREGESFTANLTANDGCTLSDVTVKMGGADITSTAVSGGTISIASVTGNIIITAVAESNAPTNLLPLAVDADGSLYNDGAGYKSGYKISTSSGSESAKTGAAVSGFMPLSSINDVVCIANVAISAEATVNNIVFYDADKARVYGAPGEAGVWNTGVKIEDNYIWFTPITWTRADIAFFRFSCGGITDETIVTVNEEIV